MQRAHCRYYQHSGVPLCEQQRLRHPDSLLCFDGQWTGLHVKERRYEKMEDIDFRPPRFLVSFKRGTPSNIVAEIMGVQIVNASGFPKSAVRIESVPDDAALFLDHLGIVVARLTPADYARLHDLAGNPNS